LHICVLLEIIKILTKKSLGIYDQVEENFSSWE